jgi:hypothetical protein
MQAQAAESSGYAWLRRTMLLLFGKKNLKTVCFDSFIQIVLLNRRGSVFLRAF